jgi:hypothetical protein
VGNLVDDDDDEDDENDDVDISRAWENVRENKKISATDSRSVMHNLRPTRILYIPAKRK